MPLLTTGTHRSTFAVMEPDDPRPVPNDPVVTLATQDLDPLSVAELEARIAALEREVARVRRHLERAADHRASADALFRS
jgi:uncharacterized small protein (DUF1192 family)